MSVETLSPTEWHDRFVRESDENAKLRAELDDARAKYDALLEASLQQMASRIDSNQQQQHQLSVLIHSSSNGSHEEFPQLQQQQQHQQPSSSPSNFSSSDKSSSSSSTPLKSKKIPFIGSIFTGGGRGKGGEKEKKEKDLKGVTDMGDEMRTSLFHMNMNSSSTSYVHVPRLQVCPIVSRNHVSIAGTSGPVGPVATDEAGSSYYSDIVAGRYPHIPGNPNRDGDPIADRYSALVYENRVIAAVADGCNWGAKPREAALRANSAFVEYVNASHESITDVKKAGTVLLSAFEHAHNSIMEGKLAFWEAGTTTLLGGVLLEINKGTDKFTPQWEFVCASVGDCKAFCYSKETGEITDITEGNRQNASDPRDCGGRLGPHLDEGKPDLRNLNLFCHPCDAGDLIFIVTDGIHDNLDPQHLGKVPKDMPKEFNLSGDKWDDVDPAKATLAKNKYTTDLLLRLLSAGEGEMPTPKEVGDKLIQHCINVTHKSREYMENNQGKRIPEDYMEYPGKMDHTTCLCLRVGRFPTLPEKNNNNNTNGSPFISPTSATSPLNTSASSFSFSQTIAPSSSPNLGISAPSSMSAINSNGNSKEEGSPRMGSPNSSSTKLDYWTKISPSIKHSN